MPEVRLITPITRQSTKKMQVAAYCRVSSNSADQLNSYAAQIRAYKNASEHATIGNWWTSSPMKGLLA